MNFASIQDTWLLVLIVFALGAKHGLDPDHLATIDGLARFNVTARPRLARWSGALFSLGHGMVVTLVAALVASASGVFAVPQWLEGVGAWISIVFLLLLGGANIVAVIRAPRDQLVATFGLRARWISRVSNNGHPMVIAAVGAAFALSFDTWSQAALFSLAAHQMSGVVFAVTLGLVFTLGMMVADGLNAWWIAGLLAKADRRARVTSRVMGLVVGFLSLAIAALGIARAWSPEVAHLLEGAGVALAAGVIVMLLASFALAMRLSDPVKAV